jgi:ribonuclease P protein component
MQRLTKRAEFVAIAGGTKVSLPGFSLQARRRARGASEEARFGFTVTKKIGNAVVRNRIRRRLREVVRLSGEAAPPLDFVLVGRRAALTLPFERLAADLRSGFMTLAKRQVADAR